MHHNLTQHNFLALLISPGPAPSPFNPQVVQFYGSKFSNFQKEVIRSLARGLMTPDCSFQHSNLLKGCEQPSPPAVPDGLLATSGDGQPLTPIKELATAFLNAQQERREREAQDREAGGGAGEQQQGEEGADEGELWGAAGMEAGGAQGGGSAADIGTGGSDGSLLAAAAPSGQLAGAPSGPFQVLHNNTPSKRKAWGEGPGCSPPSKHMRTEAAP